MNRFIGIGNLGSNPNLRTTPSGGAVTNFSIAIDRKFFRGQGENKELVKETDWIPIVCWGSLANVCSQYLTKGSKVSVTGTLRPRKYVDKDGNMKHTFEVVAQDVGFLDKIQSSQATTENETV